jgi:hypothetical protein
MRFMPPFSSALPDVAEKGLIAAVDEYVLRIRAFYNARASWHRRFYRLSGILVILIGSALPLLANAEFDGQPFAISAAGVAVAVLTGLHTFYRWDQSWVLLRNTERTITTEYWKWRTTLAAENHLSDAEVVAATQAFLSTLSDIRGEEAQVFFQDLSFPTAVVSQARP